MSQRHGVPPARCTGGDTCATAARAAARCAAFSVRGWRSIASRTSAFSAAAAGRGKAVVRARVGRRAALQQLAAYVHAACQRREMQRRVAVFVREVIGPRAHNF